MIVTDGGLNDAAVRRELDLKYPSIMKKPNPIDAVFKDKAKFDGQNPIIGSLVAQIQESKTNEKAILNQISGKDIELAERLAKLRGKNNNDNNNNFPPFLLPPPPPPTPLPSPHDGANGESDDDDDDDDDDNRNLPPTQRFLLDQPQRTAVVVGTNNGVTSMLLQEKKVRFSENLNKVFPEANEIFESSQLSDPTYTISKMYGFRAGKGFHSLGVKFKDIVLSDFKIELKLKDQSLPHSQDFF